MHGFHTFQRFYHKIKISPNFSWNANLYNSINLANVFWLQVGLQQLHNGNSVLDHPQSVRRGTQYTTCWGHCQYGGNIQFPYMAQFIYFQLTVNLLFQVVARVSRTCSKQKQKSKKKCRPVGVLPFCFAQKCSEKKTVVKAIFCKSFSAKILATWSNWVAHDTLL